MWGREVGVAGKGIGEHAYPNWARYTVCGQLRLAVTSRQNDSSAFRVDHEVAAGAQDNTISRGFHAKPTADG